MRATFTIPGKLPGLNDIIRKAYHNRFSANTLKKKSQKLIGQHIVASRIPIFKDPVVISFDWIEPDHRRDIDNISGGGRKYILDALVECGKLQGDSRRYIQGFVDQFPDPDKHNPHIRVTIETLDESPSEQNGAGDLPSLEPGFEGV